MRTKEGKHLADSHNSGSKEHHKSGMMDKLFHHKDKHADEQSGAVGEQSGGSAAQQSQGQPQQHGHKESEKVRCRCFVIQLPAYYYFLRQIALQMVKLTFLVLHRRSSRIT